MKKILLLNAEGVQAICLARSLRKQGHRVIGFCNHKMSSGYATRWLTEKHKTPDISLEEDKFKAYLESYLKENSVDLIIPLADDGARFLSLHKEEIERGYKTKCAIPSFEVFDAASDKQKLMALCQRYGFSHPRTASLPPVNGSSASRQETELDRVIKYVRFPALIKPNLSQGAKGLVRVENIEELMKSYPDVYNSFGDCTLQEFIDQPEYYYNVMLYRDRYGRMDNFTIIKIRRFFPLKGGTSCYSETVRHDILLNQCKEVLEKLDWKGFADFDVLEDKNTGELKLIEINPRVPSSFQAAFAAGVDFGKVFISDTFGESMPTFDYKVGKQVRWMGLDVMWFIFSKERFCFKPSWFKFFGKNVSYHDGALNDPLPMVAGIFAGIAKYMNPEFRKAKLKG